MLALKSYSTYLYICKNKYALVAQLDRASASEAEGHRFDSCLAQWYLINVK
jgi:hypothetical protein